MAGKPYEIVAPIPVYTADHTLLGTLAKELKEERERTFNLARDLALEKHKTQQLECYFLSLVASTETKINTQTEEKKKISKNESCDTLASFSDLNENGPQIGTYSRGERIEKIKKYKEKIKKYRQRVHVSRNFGGRSVVAKIKPRVNGKFVKTASQDNLNPGLIL